MSAEPKDNATDSMSEEDRMAAEWAAALSESKGGDAGAATEVAPTETVAPAAFANFTPTGVSGAGNDIKQASGLARRMVTEFGMSEAVGPVHYGSDDENVFLGKDFTVPKRYYSESVAQIIDDEVRSLVMEGHETARRLLTDNREILDKLAQALLDRETLDADDVDAVVSGRELSEKPKVVIPSYADREKAAKEKRRAASIFGAPKPATSTCAAGSLRQRPLPVRSSTAGASCLYSSDAPPPPSNAPPRPAPPANRVAPASDSACSGGMPRANSFRSASTSDRSRLS